MATIKHKLERAAWGKAFDYAYNKLDTPDRQKAILEIFDLAEKQVNNLNMGFDLTNMRELLMDENSALSKYINRIINQIDKNILRTFFLNFIFEAMMCGTKEIHKNRTKYGCNIPWLILMDPTSACNLKCVGCWAAEYGHKLNLTLDEMDNIVKQGKELGIYYYMYTGGEPLVRKDDLIRMCKLHPDCAFVAFTNGTLVDQKFCDDLKEVGNLYLAISLEGFEDANDQRRGQGVFDKVMDSMDLLKKNGCLFGTSIAYTKNNIDVITSDEFVDMEIEKGVQFTMHFHLMPVGKDASPELMPTMEQRKYMHKRIRELRNMKDGKGYFCFDFQNDGEFVGGCIAGGRNYFHINANGDAEPCVFIHYSNTNIRENSLIEVLQSPLFMAYHDNQPFNKNMLRPCPMLENPEILPKLVRETGAKSTDLQDPETPEELCAKCHKYAEQWKPIAKELWTASPNSNEEVAKEMLKRKNYN